MQPCPDCQCPLESWEIVCRQCGKTTAASEMPIVAETSPDLSQLKDGYERWFSEGRAKLTRGDFEGAAVCFHEAEKRAKALEDADRKMLEAKRYLVQALEKTGKMLEAASQCLTVATMTIDPEEQQKYRTRAELLAKDSDIRISAQRESFVTASLQEARIVPLFCGSCKRPLSEAEVYSLRRGVSSRVRCVCKWEGMPLTKHDHRYELAMKQGEGKNDRKQNILTSASEEFSGGKKRIVAGTLALLLGNFGVHKFYLGERDAGFLYLMFCWSLVPWVVAWFDAVRYYTMSPISFNLTYNVEHVLQRIPVVMSSQPDRSEVFSMEITEDPEDFVDEYTEPRTVS